MNSPEADFVASAQGSVEFANVRFCYPMRNEVQVGVDSNRLIAISSDNSISSLPSFLSLIVPSFLSDPERSFLVRVEGPNAGFGWVFGMRQVDRHPVAAALLRRRRWRR